MGLVLSTQRACVRQDEGESTSSGSIPIVYDKSCRVDKSFGDVHCENAIVAVSDGGEVEGVPNDTVQEGISRRNCGLSEGVVGGECNMTLSS